MKIILNDTPDSAINIKDITDEHIVVGCINTEPVIITREKFNNGDYV